jgi:hypothetical protein
MHIIMVHMAMVVLWATSNMKSQYTREKLSVNTASRELRHSLE